MATLGDFFSLERFYNFVNLLNLVWEHVLVAICQFPKIHIIFPNLFSIFFYFLARFSQLFNLNLIRNLFRNQAYFSQVPKSNIPISNVFTDCRNICMKMLIVPDAESLDNFLLIYQSFINFCLIIFLIFFPLKKKFLQLINYFVGFVGLLPEMIKNPNENLLFFLHLSGSKELMQALYL